MPPKTWSDGTTHALTSTCNDMERCYIRWNHHRFATYYIRWNHTCTDEHMHWRAHATTSRCPWQDPNVRKEPVRFDSFRFRTSTINWFGSENIYSRFYAVRPAFFWRVTIRPCSIRFGSLCGSGRFRNYMVRFGSVRPVRFGFLFVQIMRTDRRLSGRG